MLLAMKGVLKIFPQEMKLITNELTYCIDEQKKGAIK
jgi:hypothetical protein